MTSFKGYTGIPKELLTGCYSLAAGLMLITGGVLYNTSYNQRLVEQSEQRLEENIIFMREQSRDRWELKHQKMHEDFTKRMEEDEIKMEQRWEEMQKQTEEDQRRFYEVLTNRNRRPMPPRVLRILPE
jgi:hypothetical protein